MKQKRCVDEGKGGLGRISFVVFCDSWLWEEHKIVTCNRERL